MDGGEKENLLEISSTPPAISFLRNSLGRGGERPNYDSIQASGSGEHRFLRKSQEGKASARNPFLINSQIISGVHDDEHINTVAQYNRYRYYAKLHGHHERIIIPDHAVPSYLFLPLPAFVKAAIEEGKQSSIITIFAIWNTMMGTSLLSMPWAITQSGLGLGIGIMLFMGAICLGTCLLILKSAASLEVGSVSLWISTMLNVAVTVFECNVLCPSSFKDSDKHEAFEFSDVCHHYLGKWAKLTCIIFSILALLGAAIVYWVLLSNFLFSAGKFIFDHSHALPQSSFNRSLSTSKVLCTSASGLGPQSASKLTPSDDGVFFHLWKQKMTVPFYLILILFPLSCFKSPTFFTKFNALGTLAVFYMLVFIVTKAVSWGPHLYENTGEGRRISLINWSSLQFPSLSGTLGLALYIHNCILSITRNQMNPKNNTRDVCIAYVLAIGTYLVMGVVSYICFPLAKSCIEEVFLDNFPTSDVLTFTAQVFLLFQMVTVYPLLLYIVRVQLLTLLFGQVFPGWLHIIVLNSMVIGLGIVFAVFYPHVGHIIRYVGSISALVYIFGLPCMNYMAILYQKKELTRTKAIFFSFIVFLGVVNFVLQFFVS